MKKKLLVTGGAGFIGSHFIRHILKTYPNYEIINLDALTYCGNLKNLQDIEQDSRYTFVNGDILDSALLDTLAKKEIDAIINFAAESHVDRSILDATAFLNTNIQGVRTLLEIVKKYRSSTILPYFKLIHL